MKNKKAEGLLFDVLFVVVVLLVIFLYLFLISLPSKKEEPINICNNKPSTLSCNKLRICYDECNELNLINLQANCRDKLKPYIWDCTFKQQNNLEMGE